MVQNRAAKPAQNQAAKATTMTQNQNRSLRFGLPGIILLSRSPFSFVFFLVMLPLFPLEQFFF
jgi:hypothetical protein